MTVIDASALTKYILRESGWEDVESYLIQGVTSVDYILKEVANAIWKWYTVFGRIDRDNALKMLSAVLMLVEGDVIKLEPEDKYLSKAFEIALNNSITVYDALYIAQAITNKLSLLTSDKKQADAAERIGVEAIYIP